MDASFRWHDDEGSIQTLEAHSGAWRGAGGNVMMGETRAVKGE